MTRSEREWALVPAGARWTAAVVVLGFMTLMALMARGKFVPLLLAALVGALTLGAFVLLVGYVYGDARRRSMNHVMWTLLAVLAPSGIGIILYFILRDPLPVPCPHCATPARKDHAFCACCGTAMRAACPQCRQPVEAAWRNCAHCGTALRQEPVERPAAET